MVPERYRRILGFTRVEELSVWALEGGPLTLKNTEGMEHFKEQDLELRLADHTLAWSIYLSDPFGNYHEIAHYEHAFVAKCKTV